MLSKYDSKPRLSSKPKTPRNFKKNDWKLKRFEDVLPEDLKIIDHIDSQFSSQVYKTLSTLSSYDYVTVVNNIGVTSYWSIPEKVKRFKIRSRDKKLSDLGI